MPNPPRFTLHLLVVASMLAGATAQPVATDPERSYRSATGLLNRGMNDLAAQEYRTFLEANPNSPKAPQARYGLAVCLVRLGKPSEALPHLDQIINLSNFEFAADALLLKAQCLMAAGDSSATVTLLEQLLKAHPKFESIEAATALLGEAQYAAGQVTAARTTLADALTRWPSSASAERVEYLLALCESAEGDREAAVKRLARWREGHRESPLFGHATLLEAQCRHRLGDARTAQTLYAMAAEHAEGELETEAVLGSAQLLRAGGDAAKALELLTKLSSKTPGNSVEGAIGIEMARCHFDAAQYDTALQLLKGIEDSRHSDEAAFWSGRCLLKLNRPAEALATFRDAAAASPKSPLHAELLLEQAAALTAMGNHQDAAALCETVAASDSPAASRARLALAAALHRAGKYQQSIEACTACLNAADSTVAAKADALLLIAENHYLLRAHEAAHAAYTNFIRVAPDHAQIWRAQVRRGLCLAQLDRGAEAAAALAPLVEQPGANDPALIRAACTCLGELAFSASDWATAHRWFSAAVNGAGADADPSRLKLGLALVRLKRLEEAVTVFDTIAVTDSPSDAAIQATFERGQALIELSRPKEARLAFERTLALEANVSSPRFRQHALRHLAAIASAQGRTSDAAAYLEQIAAAPGSDESASLAALDRVILLLGQGEYAKAAASCAAFIKANPSHPRLHQARTQHAIALSRLGKLDEALKAFDALAADPATLEPALAAAAAYEHAWILSQTKNPARAADAYLAVLNMQLEPRIESHAALELAQLKIAANDFTGAIPLLERAQKAASAGEAQSTFEARCTYLKGVCQWRAGQPAQAAQTLGDFEATYPDSELRDSAAITLGEALLASNQASQAVKVLSLVAERATQPPTQSAALLRLGEAAAAASDWAASERAFARHRKLFEDSDQWFRAAFGLGFALENAGKREAAIASYRTVIAGHDGATAARAQFQIGECLYGLGKLDEAVAELLKVDILYQYPQWSAAALHEAGRCLVEQNKHAQGIEQFEQVMKRFPDSTWASASRDAAAAARPSALPGRDAPARTNSTPSTRTK
jgi:tetratricopeptide (TPR) repeat protein